jgi:tetratricopeptide (TPR) repeat protein
VGVALTLLTRALKQVDELHKQGRYQEALDVLNGIVDADCEDFETLFARFYRARSFEGGFFGEVDLQRAEDDYRYLVNYFESKTDILGGEPYIGLARVMFKRGNHASHHEIVRLCEHANGIKRNKKAMLIIGASSELLVSNYSLASKYYLKALLLGSKWGSAYYSRAIFKSGKYLSWIASIVLLSISYPVLVLIDRSKYPII